VLVYEAFVFMKPGLYPHERRYFLAVVPVSVILVTIGLAFSYFVALEFLFQYFLTYSEPVAISGLGLRETFNLIILLSLGMGIVFQIPLLMFMAIKMRVASREWFASKRIIIWAVFLSVAFLFAPDPTGMAAIIVAATMVFLFELTLLLLRFTSRDKTKSKRQEIEETGSESVGTEGVTDTTNGGYEALDYDEYTPDSLTEHQEELEKQVEEFEVDTSEDTVPRSITDIDGIGERRAEALREAGFETVADIRRVTQDELTEVKGIGEVLAAKIKKEVGSLNNEEVDDQESE
ncbi:MAG: twin-arginine translocase subunit TatC, partial [Halobacteria archaeon]|nr:twin-arginine translocase subunit TatC [Halobacteria archaeon]